KRPIAFAATAVLIAGVFAAVPVATAGTDQTYVVVYKSQAAPRDATAAITRAGGTLVAMYGQIGVAIARPSSATFSATLERNSSVAAAASTAGSGMHLIDDQTDADTTTIDTPASDSDNLSGLQWDMVQIHTPEAHAITGGSSAIVVGDIDTGLDYTHPDLAANVDSDKSANCLSGAAVPGAVAANDDNGHETHTRGTIAEAC